MKKSIFVFLSLISLHSFMPSALAAGNSTIVVNIDNPDFRKLTAAIPTFDSDAAASEKVKAGAKEGAAELTRLLDFSGLFNFLSEDAFSGAIQKGAQIPIGANNGLAGIDLPTWKGLGVESLTMAKLYEEAGKFTLEIRTVDINKGVLILGKKFAGVSELKPVIRRYADLLLEAYTGKPGIFNTKLVFVGRPSKKAEKQIYISDFDGSNAKAITSGKGPNLSPSWSPDGKFVLFTSFAAGNPDLYIYEVATGKKRKLSAYKGLNSGGVFSPDGKVIAYTGSVDGDADIYTIPPKGGNRTAMIRGTGLDVDPMFSPNGKHMAFVSGRFGNPHIFISDIEWSAENTKVKVLGDKRLTYAGWYNATPAFNPESDRIAFAGYDKETDRFDIFMMGLDGKNLERLTLRVGDNESPSWSPNGHLIVFQSNRIGTQNTKGPAMLYIMNKDGSNQRPLSTGLEESFTPRWSPRLGE